VILHNPILTKDLRGRMKGSRAFILLTAYIAVLSIFIGLIMLAFMVSGSYLPRPGASQVISKTLFAAILGMELLIVCFLSPALTSGAISAERERQTYDLLRTTLLSALELVLGKLFSALAFIVLLLVAALPLHSIAFLFGGLTIHEFTIGTLILFVCALTFSSVGLFCLGFPRKSGYSEKTRYT
jgi:ABC-2 type transport system permease protein